MNPAILNESNNPQLNQPSSLNIAILNESSNPQWIQRPLTTSATPQWIQPPLNESSNHSMIPVAQKRIQYSMCL